MFVGWLWKIKRCWIAINTFSSSQFWGKRRLSWIKPRNRTKLLRICDWTWAIHRAITPGINLITRKHQTETLQRFSVLQHHRRRQPQSKNDGQVFSFSRRSHLHRLLRSKFLHFSPSLQQTSKTKFISWRSADHSNQPTTIFSIFSRTIEDRTVQLSALWVIHNQKYYYYNISSKHNH